MGHQRPERALGAEVPLLAVDVEGPLGGALGVLAAVAAAVDRHHRAERLHRDLERPAVGGVDPDRAPGEHPVRPDQVEVELVAERRHRHRRAGLVAGARGHRPQAAAEVVLHPVAVLVGEHPDRQVLELDGEPGVEAAPHAGRGRAHAPRAVALTGPAAAVEALAADVDPPLVAPGLHEVAVADEDRAVALDDLRGHLEGLGDAGEGDVEREPVAGVVECQAPHAQRLDHVEAKGPGVEAPEVLVALAPAAHVVLHAVAPGDGEPVHVPRVRVDAEAAPHQHLAATGRGRRR